MFSALPLTGTAEIFLLPIGRSTVAYKCIALTMRTMNCDRYHGILPLSTCCRYSTTSFSFGPLPQIARARQAERITPAILTETFRLTLIPHVPIPREMPASAPERGPYEAASEEKPPHV